jgi:Chitobiase/beta-hexosaminidase C-terminal domain
MHTTFASPSSFRYRASRRLGLIALGSISLAVFPLLHAQTASQPILGMAWQVRGQWQMAGKSQMLRSGDAIPPGALLQPGNDAGSHSIRVYLPDGQHVLYACYAAADCARGFRVPLLYRRPEPFAVNMLARVRAVMARDDHAPDASKPDPQRRLPRDEVVAELGPGNQVQVAGLAASLPNGAYTYDLRPIEAAIPGEFHRPLDKTASSISLTLPGAGLFDLRITDNRNVPRIDLFIAAVTAAGSARIAKPFQRASSLLGDWNIDYQGWPIHDFQWAFLQSLVMNVRPPAGAPAGLSLAGDPPHSSAVAAEPVFSPRPGVFKGDTAVTLLCATPGATMHFTVDTSQPLAGSPVYKAPIMVKGTELTIKAYAAADGKKDSPVVTGIFRIQEDQ